MLGTLKRIWLSWDIFHMLAISIRPINQVVPKKKKWEI